MVQQTFGERMGAVYTSACISYLAQQFGFAYVGLNMEDALSVFKDMNERLMNHENTSWDTGFKAWEELPHPFVTRRAGTASTPMTVTFTRVEGAERLRRVQGWLDLCTDFNIGNAADTNRILGCVTVVSRFAHQFARAVLGAAYNNLLPVRT